MFDSRMRESLDRWITGNYGEDRFSDSDEESEQPSCPVCGRVEFTITEVGNRIEYHCMACGEDFDEANAYE